MKSVFVIWKDITDGMWHPVAQLTRTEGIYRLNYTKGSNHPNFIPFPRMSNKTTSYVSSELFAFFKNRLLPMNHPEFRKMVYWSDLNLDTYDELDMLGISGGARKTDQYRIIPKPQVVSGNEYKLRFFTNGVSHLAEENTKRISELLVSEQLDFECEESNPHDFNAILVTTIDEEKIKVGYCPKYYNSDVKKLLETPELMEHHLTVVKTNLEAPAQFRLLCEFTTKWPDGFIPFTSEDYLAHTVN